MYRRTSIVFLLSLILASRCLAQFLVVDSIRVQHITHLSIDKNGYIYTGDRWGNVQKYDHELKKRERYSPERGGGVAVLECWNPLRLFVSYRDTREYVFLNRFLADAGRFRLNETIYAGLIAPSSDHTIWYIDYADLILRKFDPAFHQTQTDRPLNLLLNPKDHELTHLKEYQNLLFLSDSKSGILVFDNFANFLYSIKAEGVGYFNFYKDEIYYLEKGKIVRRKLYSDEVNTLPPNGRHNVKAVLIYQKDYYWLTPNYLIRAKIP